MTENQPAKTFAELRTEVIDVLKTCYDPEIPVDIYELGLVYEVNVDPGNNVKVLMTLTSPTCPVAETLPPEVEQKIKGIPGVGDVKVELTWEPQWTQDMMSESAKLELGFL
jgi:FeS assembly SUF system protein